MKLINHMCVLSVIASILFLGSGTQKIQEELINMIPNVRILRMDIDTTRKKVAIKKYYLPLDKVKQIYC